MSAAPITDMPACTGLVEKTCKARKRSDIGILSIPSRYSAALTRANLAAAFLTFLHSQYLSEKTRIMAGVSHFLARESNKDRKKTFAISKG